MSKKMCPENSSTPKKSGNNPNLTNQSGVQAARQFDPPVYKENRAGGYIEFRAYDPERGKMRRKTMKINRVKGVTNRRTYARRVIKRLIEQLNNGWNPWIANDTGDLIVFDEVVKRYELHIEKMLASGYYRKETYDGYKSYVKIMREYISKKRPTYYVYQFNRSFCVDFLDYVFIERDNGAQTRDNYLNFLRVFSDSSLKKAISKANRPPESLPSASDSTRKSASAYLLTLSDALLSIAVRSSLTFYLLAIFYIIVLFALSR